MNASRWCIAGLVVALIVVASVGGTAQERQSIAATSVGRYQISSFGTGTANLVGCYVIDTETGSMWLIQPNIPPKKIVDKLP